MSESQLQLCERIAREAHADQFRRDGVTPYIRHVEAVVSRCGSDKEKCVAWLHDVFEDTNFPPSEMRGQGVEESIICCAGNLTNDEEWNYSRFIDRVLASECKICRNVKIADILSNLADSPTDKQIIKYAKALLVLVGENI